MLYISKQPSHLPIKDCRYAGNRRGIYHRLTEKTFRIDNTSSYFLKLALLFIEHFFAFVVHTSIEQACFHVRENLLQPLLFANKAGKSNHLPVSVLVSRAIGFPKCARCFLLQ